jgi:SAM-dependent methyltransferase
VRVIAVEPNAAMRSEAEPHALVEFRERTAEATGLDAESVDLVTCGQAFHWFEPLGALSEFARVLRPGGRVALVWNDRDTADPLTAEYGVLIRHASGYHPAAEDRSMSGRALEESPLFENARVRMFRYEQPLTLEGLIGRARSASYCPKEGPGLDELVRGLTDLHARYAGERGIVRMVYSTRVYAVERG